jgi:hypothetical protein
MRTNPLITAAKHESIFINSLSAIDFLLFFSGKEFYVIRTTHPYTLCAMPLQI